MNTYITAILSIILTTNEVKIGTATINGQQFELVGLQVVTNRIVRNTSPLTGPISWSGDEYWTNQSLGPIVATNFVPRKGITISTDATNVYAPWIQMKDLVITNQLAFPYYYYNNLGVPN